MRTAHGILWRLDTLRCQSLSVMLNSHAPQNYGPVNRRSWVILSTTPEQKAKNDRPSAATSPPSSLSVAGAPMEIECSWLAAFGSVGSVAAVEVDGRQLLASGGGDGTVRLWDPRDGTAVGEPLTGHTRSVRAVAAVEVDGRQLLASGGGDGTVRLWDPRDGTAVGEPLTGHTRSVRAVAAVEVDGRQLLASGGGDGTVRLWDPRDGTAVGEPLTGHTRSVGSVAAVEVDGRQLLASGGGDGTVRLWDPRDGTAVGEPLTGHTRSVRAVAAVEVDGRQLLASGGDGGTVRLWDPRDGTAVGEPLTGHTRSVGAVAAVEVDGRQLLASGGGDGTVRLWDPRDGTAVGEPLTGHTDWVQAVAAVEVDGRQLLASGGGDGTVRLWDPRDGTAVGEPLTGHTRSVRAVAAVEVDGRQLLASGGVDGTVRLWDPRDGTAVGEPLTGHTRSVRAVAAVEVDGRQLLASGGDGTVRLWDPRDGTAVGEPLTGHTDWVQAVAAVEVDGRQLLASGGGDGTVRLWDPRDGTAVGEPLTGHTAWVQAVAAVEVDGRQLLASGGGDGTVRLWDPRDGTAVGELLTGHTDAVRAVAAVEVDGRQLLASGGVDGTVRLWDPRDGTAVGEPLTGHTDWVQAVAAVEVDGRQLLASGGVDGTVRLWDPRDGTAVGEPLTGHTRSVRAVAAVEVDGRQLLASGGVDGDIVLWATGRPNGGEYVPDVQARVLSDQVAAVDLLELDPLAEAIRATIVHPATEAPVTIAVKGPWGSGKSTVMNLVRNKLDPPRPGGEGGRQDLPLPATRTAVRSNGRPLRFGEALRVVGRLAATPRGNDARGEEGVGHRAVLPDDVARVTVWFNPWFYETGGQVWAGLAHELITQVSDRFTRLGRERFWLRLNLKRVDPHAVRRAFYALVLDKVLKYVALLVVTAVAVALKFTPAAAAVMLGGGVAAALLGTAIGVWFAPAAGALEGLTRGPVHDAVDAVHGAVPSVDTLAPALEYDSRAGYMHLVRTDLQRVIDVVAPDPAHPLVVFIDDLDRCSPSTVMQTLEAINLFLAGELRNCIFVLGIEPALLASHIEVNHGELLETLRAREPLLANEDLSWRFLEKLLQLSVRLPEASSDAVRSYMGALLQDARDQTSSDPARPERYPAGAVKPTTRAAVWARPGDAEAYYSDPAADPYPDTDPGDDPADPRDVSDGEPRASPQVALEVARKATRARARAAVRAKLRLDDTRVRQILADAVEVVGSNPRALKRLVNLFVFTSYVAAERTLLTTSSEDAILDDLRKVSHACVLLIRWPQFTERLAKPTETGDAPDRRTVLEELAGASASANAWNRLVEGVGLVPHAKRKPDDPPVLLPDLREFMSENRSSMPLVAKLI